MSDEGDDADERKKNDVKQWEAQENAMSNGEQEEAEEIVLHTLRLLGFVQQMLPTLHLHLHFLKERQFSSRLLTGEKCEGLR